ncbi:sulfotransferase [Porphyrobacter sp. GA68]|uniref:sulfotransferase family protein n=1 Tax=Porphyrobacter sp. GA68 TaxID=2883480 RepID=UPI001D180F30|nr:sulfotransferase [Porphyrobacter sp. GA68]
MAPPRPHPLTRSRSAARLNTLLGEAWARGWATRPELSAEAILTAGSRGFNAGDEGGGRCSRDVADFRDRLEVLARSLTVEAQLNHVGRATAYGMLVRTVRQRLALGRLWRQQPALLTTQLASPLIVLGQMRGGTTRVHHLLAADPAHSFTRFCDSWHPVPARPDLRHVKSALALRLARILNPWLDILHPMRATGAEEELGWMATALAGSAYYTQWHVPGFTRWCEETDPASVYTELARILRTDANHRGLVTRPRVMKVPEFSEAIPALLAQFPDARLIWARREPAEVADSAASLVAAQMAPQTDCADFTVIRAEWQRKTALREERLARDLADAQQPLAMVEFAELESDWRAAIRRLYRDLRLELTPAALQAMTRLQRKAQQGAHQQHREQRRAFPSEGHPTLG